MAVRAVRPVFQQQAGDARRGRDPRDAVADAEEVHALPFHGRLLLLRVAVVEHRDGELLEMGVEVPAGLVEDQQVARIAVAAVSVFVDVGIAADDRVAARIVRGRRRQVRVAELQRRIEQPLQGAVVIAVHVNAMVPQLLGVHDQRLQRHELVAHGAFGPHAIHVNRLREVPLEQAAGRLLLGALETVESDLDQLLVVARIAGRQDRAGVNRRPVGRRLDRRVVLGDMAAVGPYQVVLDVLPLGGRDRGQIMDQVVAARHLDQPRGVAQALVEDLARVVVEARPGADSVIGINIGVGQQQFLAELRVLLLARESVHRPEVGDVQAEPIVNARRTSGRSATSNCQ